MQDIRIGAPTLYAQTETPTARDDCMKLPKAWLKVCDKKHNHTCAPKRTSPRLPKRLIEVKKPLRRSKIIETTPDMDPEKFRYVAFSHKWGDPGRMPPSAMTTVDNLEERKISIPMDEMPASFKKAIAITNALGCQYLWIDSLCINQGPNGDFNEQADKMQSTFSGAYCVLAASSAADPTAGFLHRREPTESVKIGKYFVCEITNDFERDVLQSPLNRRGWVLQERALVRRTIFFTETQIYFECGDGVQCETLAKLRSEFVI
jgi:hypothetical protein